MHQPLLLRPFADEDLALFRRWLERPHVAKWYHHPENWLREAAERRGEFSFITHLIVEEGGVPVGFCQYYPYEKSGEDWQGETPVHGTYSIDYLIGDPENLGRGLGKGIVWGLLGEIAARPDAVRVIVQPEEENLPSCGVLAACGFRFVEEGGYFLKEL